MRWIPSSKPAYRLGQLLVAAAIGVFFATLLAAGGQLINALVFGLVCIGCVIVGLPGALIVTRYEDTHKNDFIKGGNIHVRNHSTTDR